MTRKRNKIRKAKKDTYTFVVDGKNEYWYFQMLKRNEPDLQINIEPKFPQKKELSEQYEKVIELAADFTKVFWIIDLDVIIKESKETGKGKRTPVQKLKQYIIKLEKNHNNVVTILNNPCLEFWFLLHFKGTTKYFPLCKSVIKQLKTYLSDYEKTQKYYTRQGNDIYLRLKSKLSVALKNTRKTQRKNLDEIDNAICEMNRFFETRHIQIKY